MSGRNANIRHVIMRPSYGVHPIANNNQRFIMTRFIWIPLLLALFLVPATAQAQTDISVGPKVGFDLGDLNEPYIGADVRIELEDFPVRINPMFNFYFAPENVTWWSVGANGLFDFELDDNDITPYAGAGLQLFRTSVSFGGASASSSNLGLTGVGGAEFDLDGFRPFVQAELGIITGSGTGTLFGIGGGVLFDI